MSHALVVGGTGMLFGLSVELARRFRALTVVARRASRLAALGDAIGAMGTLNPVALDWHDDQALAAALRAAQDAHGPIDLAVCWIHGSAPRAPRLVAERIAPARFVHVVGSAAGDPARVGDARRDAVASVPGIDYRQVILGFVLEGERSRWLTDAEIARGTLAALESEEDPRVVGTIRPWSRRP